MLAKTIQISQDVTIRIYWFISLRKNTQNMNQKDSEKNWTNLPVEFEF